MHTLKYYFIFMLINSLFLSTLAHAVNVEKQNLLIGRTKSLETGYDIGDAAISDYKICDFMIMDSRKEIYLNPKKSGVVTLTLWDEAGKKRDVVPISVSNTDLEQIVSDANTLLEDSNIDVRIKSGRVELRGEALSKSELEVVKSLEVRYPQITSHVIMSKEILETVARKVEAAIAIPGIKVKNVRGRLVLEGLAYSASSAKRAYEIAKLYEPSILNLLDIKESNRRPGKEDLVKLNVYFMEFKKEAMRSLGVNWAPGSFPSSGDTAHGDSGILGGVAGIGKSVIGFVFNLIPKVRFLREKGEARVLDTASLVVKSGEKGSFFSGTQVPYYAGDSVSFKNVGIRINAEPIISGRNVDLSVKLSLNSISANVDAGIDTRDVSTNAYIEDGSSLVLADMISNHDVKTYNRKPSGIDTSTALFTLFLSKDFQTGRSEFVVFVEPEIIHKMLPAERELKQYLSVEKDMIRDRSKKEYEEFVNRKNANTSNRKRRKRKWR